MKIRMTFEGLGLWDGGDTFPYDDTPFPRVPVVGERVRLPDSTDEWEVVSVVFDFDRGFHYEPTVRVTLALRTKGAS
jgi:hypothetical protein